MFIDCYNKHGQNCDDIRKMATPGLLKIKLFWNKSYLPLEQALTLHNIMVRIKSFFSENHTATAIYCVEFFFLNVCIKLKDNDIFLDSVIMRFVKAKFAKEKFSDTK